MSQQVTLRRTVFILLIGGALLFGGWLPCAAAGDSVNGSGKAKSEDRSISDVSEVATSGGGAIEITLGDKPNVRVSADDNILPLLEVKCADGKLTFETKFGYEINPVTPITYVVTLPQLKKLTVSDAGNVKAAGLKGAELAIRMSGAANVTLKNVHCKSLSLSPDGAGQATMAGTAAKARIRSSGAGTVDATDLKSVACDAEVSGNGSARIWATDELKVRVSGTARVEYKGKPRIEQSVADKGRIQAADD